MRCILPVQLQAAKGKDLKVFRTGRRLCLFQALGFGGAMVGVLWLNQGKIWKLQVPYLALKDEYPCGYHLFKDVIWRPKKGTVLQSWRADFPCICVVFARACSFRQCPFERT